MKKLLLISAAILLAASVFAQAPKKMSYQSVIRNSSNNLVVNSPIGIRISILKGSEVGEAVYVETQLKNSNANGLVSIEIGTGTVVSGVFTAINWAQGPYFMKTETDPLGGATYTITGTSQLMSVPYALYAETSGSVVSGTIIKGVKNGDMLVWKDNSWVNIPAPTNAYGKSLVYCDGEPKWGGCLPKVQTLEPDNVGSKSATLGASVEDDGGLPITAYGFIWGENKELTLADSIVKLGVGKGESKLSFSKFQVNKTYFVKSFATNSAGTAFGQVFNFKTVASKPVVQTVRTFVENDIVYLEGFISDDGGEPILTNGFGVAYDTNSNPTTASTTKTAVYIFDGRFRVEVPNLLPGTTYYLRAYANSSAGTGYGQVISYKAPSVKIGENKFGGIVFYVDSTGEHGLVAAPSDQSTYANPFIVPYSFDYNSDILGSGNQYELFLSADPIKEPFANSSFLCMNLTLNGYSDWWLPNLKELEEMAKYSSILNLSKQSYMSSFQKLIFDQLGISFAGTSIWCLKYNVWSNSWEKLLIPYPPYQHIKIGDQFYSLVDTEPYAIRAIRAF